MGRKFTPEYEKNALFALENTPVDYIANVDESFLEKFSLRKGDFNGSDDKERVQALEKELSNIQVECGGSAANTVCGYANLGLPAAFAGSIGNDEAGKAFGRGLIDANVRPYLEVRDGKNGICYVLVTPDGERTFLVYMGVSSDFKPEEVPFNAISNSGFFHSTAYSLDTMPEALDKAIESAKSNNVRFSFDVASPKSIEKHGTKLEDVLSRTDILFVNKEEANAFGFSGDDELEIVNHMIQRYGIGLVAFKRGEKGAFISSGNVSASVLSYKVNVVNRSGAGDGFAAGMLYSLANNYDLFMAGKIASYYASRVIMQQASRLPYKLFNIEVMA